MSVITPVDLEPIIQINIGNDNDAAVIAVIGRAQDAVEGALGRKIEVETGIVETIDGSRSRSIFLSNWPVVAVTSIEEDGTLLVADDDYLFTSGGIVRRLASGYQSLWIWKPAGIVVEYEAGFEPDHVGYGDLAMVVLRVAVRMFQAGAAFASMPDGSDAISQESIGDYSVTYRKDPAPLDRTESVADAAYLTDQDLEVVGRWRTPTLA